MFGFLKKKSGYVSSVVFYSISPCNLLPFVYHKNNRRRYPDDEQESVEADAVLDEGWRFKDFLENKKRERDVAEPCNGRQISFSFCYVPIGLVSSATTGQGNKQ